MPINQTERLRVRPTTLAGLCHCIGQLSVLTGWQATGGFSLWLRGRRGLRLKTGLAFDSVNGSTAGWGVGNNNFTANEFHALKHMMWMTDGPGDNRLFGAECDSSYD